MSAWFAKSSGAQKGPGIFLGKAFLFGTAATVLPGFVLAPDLLGDRAWDVGLAALVFSVVNLHHFVLDGAIWKLRDGRVGSILLRSPEPGAAVAPSKGRWLPAMVWGVCGLAFVIPAVYAYELSVGIPGARNTDRIDQAVARLRSVGRETTRIHINLAEGFADLGRHERAADHFKRSNEIHPRPSAWAGLGDSYSEMEKWRYAAEAYAAALELDAEYVGALFGRAKMRLRAGGGLGSAAARQQASADLAQVLALRPRHSAAKALSERIIRSDAKANTRANP